MSTLVLIWELNFYYLQNISVPCCFEAGNKKPHSLWLTAFQVLFSKVNSTWCLPPFHPLTTVSDEPQTKGEIPWPFWDLLYFIYLEYKSFPRFLKFIIFHLYINQEHFYSSFTVARYVRCSSIITSCRRLILSLPLFVTRIEISSGIPFSGQINR